MAGIRANTLVRVVAGIAQVVLGLLMVWLSKQFIDVTIRQGDSDDVLRMIWILVATVVGGILLRQLYYYMTVLASTRQSNAIRLRVFSSLFHRQMYEEQLHSGDITSRLSKDIDTVADVTTTLLPQFVVTGVQLLGAFMLMYFMDSTLALALLLATPAVAVVGKLLARRLRSMTLDIRQQESTIQMQVQEGMEHNAVLRSDAEPADGSCLAAHALHRHHPSAVSFHVRTGLSICFHLGRSTAAQRSHYLWCDDIFPPVGGTDTAPHPLSLEHDAAGLLRHGQH